MRLWPVTWSTLNRLEGSFVFSPLFPGCDAKSLAGQSESGVDSQGRWLQSNPSWQDWLPDRTKCSPGFGLYDTTQDTFIGTRADPTFLECRACVSGRYSARLHDATGITHVCEFCAPGSSQASGAALQCEPCQAGKSQNNSGSQDCNRCRIGEYQDEPGSSSCKPCSGGTTLGLGSTTLQDCGCPTGFIDASESTANLSCIGCGEGRDR